MFKFSKFSLETMLLSNPLSIMQFSQLSSNRAIYYSPYFTQHSSALCWPLHSDLRSMCLGCCVVGQLSLSWLTAMGHLGCFPTFSLVNTPRLDSPVNLNAPYHRCLEGDYFFISWVPFKVTKPNCLQEELCRWQSHQPLVRAKGCPSDLSLGVASLWGCMDWVVGWFVLNSRSYSRPSLERMLEGPRGLEA